ncbi:MAG TPA: nitrile hydratase subunit beta, partial [Chloroflexota bacterium]|nr:nitrile hydratase subunit beta [Chloroflexota bacterium]
EKFLVGMIELLITSGLVTRAEVESGKPARGSKKATPALTADKVSLFVVRGAPASRNMPVAPKFRVGQRIRARNINPTGHTRLPRYARGKLGTVERDHGVFVFPDTNAHFLGENPQHVYSVRFAARELWGEHASPQDAVYINLWDDHLEPA